MKTITNRLSCTGCSACHAICPKNCIKMSLDTEGFLEPVIDEKICIDCGKCKQICPANAGYQKNTPIKALALRLRDDKVIEKSASGGVFAGIASRFISNNGYVAGCAYNENFQAVHIITSDFDTLPSIQSSKYVQSDIGDTFSQTKPLLKSGENVFFTGTPCQIAGLYAYLGKDYENLLTADVVCHGVPSPGLFNLYIKWLEHKYKEKLVSLNMRSKKISGWGTTQLYYTTQTRTWTPSSVTDPFYAHFLHGNNLRESCYRCQYANINRPADITMADYWGVEKEEPEFMDKRGISAVIVNTEKGLHWIDKVLGDFVHIETDIQKIVRNQVTLTKPSQRGNLRDIMLKNVADKDYRVFYKKPFRIETTVRVKHNVKRILKKILPKRILKVISAIRHSRI